MYQKVILVGKLGKDPKINQTKDSQVANLSVATWHSKFNKVTNSWEQLTQWHNVTVWGNAVKAVEKLTKGDYVMVEGELQTNEWKNKDGEMQKDLKVVGFAKGIKPPIKYESNYTYSQQTNNNKPNWTPDNPVAQPTAMQASDAQPNGMNFTYSGDDGADLPF